MSLSYLIHDLRKIEDSEDLIMRLNKGEDSAFSEALLATYFFKMGFEVKLEPVVVGTVRRNDLTIKVNSECVNVEVKSPQKSELQKEMEKILKKLFDFIHKMPISRTVHIFLSKEPTYEKQKEIGHETLELVLQNNNQRLAKSVMLHS